MKKFLLILMTCALALGLYAQIPANNAQPCPGTPTVTDKNGNVYNTVMIDNQCWMKENMRTTKTATGTSISDGGSTAWTSGSYYYNYSASGIPLAERGYLYNYSAATQICPTGWHLPSHAEWTAMEQHLSSVTIEENPTGSPNYWRGDHAGKLVGGNRWTSSNISATAGDLNYSLRNISGFTAVPAGVLWVGTGFQGSGTDSYFWTSTLDSSDIWYRNINYRYAPVNRGGKSGRYGLSVRCLRNKPVLSVVTGEVYDITSNHANCTSEVYSDFFIVEQGVCWSMFHNPTTDDARSISTHDSMGYVDTYINPMGASIFEGYLFGLTLGSTYYVRAYAIILNSSGNDSIYETVYGNEVSFNTPSSSCPGTALITDVDGNTYNTIRIGNRCWMKQNLRTTKKPNGTAIPAGGSNTSYYDPYYYDYSTSNIPLAERGYLYNWQAAYEACPTGWRLPTDAEWTTMEATQTSMDLSSTGFRGDHAGKLAGGSRWNTYSSIPDSTPGDISNSYYNISGFTAVPGGYYYNNGYSGSGYSALFWTSRVESGTPWNRYIYYNKTGVSRNTMAKTYGYSVRCIRNIVLASTFISSTPTTITLSGEVIDDGSVTARGVCWSTNFSSVSIADGHTNNGTGTGTFTSRITGLSPNTLYYVRTYATNSSGTFYGDTRGYRTPCPTANVSITGNTTINNGESATLTASVSGYDMCTFSWSTGAGATSQTITVSPTATTTYTVTVTDVPSNCMTTASVTVIVGIQPTVTTSNVSDIGTTLATCGGNVTNEGNVSVTARGVCWSTEHNPTIYDSHTVDGSGAGSFTSQITDLEPGVTYYVRAYATNSAGTAYGSEKSLTSVFLCAPEDQCDLTFVLTDSYGDGWNGNAIRVTDAETGTLLGIMANENRDGQYVEEIESVPLAVCNGRAINFEWVSGNWPGETSYTVYDGQGEEIFSGQGGFSETYTHTVNCCHIFLNEEDHYTYFEDFESYTASTTASTGVEPTCWELVREDVAMTDANRPQLYYKSSYAHSGNYSLRLGYRGVYAMPKLAENVDINELRLEMYLRQPNAAYQLEVGVWEPDETFVPVKRFNNSGTGVMSVTCDFSEYTGNGRRIAFRNVLGNGANYNYSYNYIDDITLRKVPVNDAKPCPGVPTVTDIDGNVYNTVQIGEQCWMKENMRTTHFADGVDIQLATYSSSTEPFRYYPNDDPNTVAEYGYLYNWAAMTHGANASDENPSGVQGICPSGWHVPSNAEWTQLTDYLRSQSVYGCGNGSDAIAKALSASTGWRYDEDVTEECGPAYNQDRNGVTGFNALPAGYYYYGSYSFGSSSRFWTVSNAYDAYRVWVYYINRNNDDVNKSYLYKYYGESVRCVLGEGGNVPVVTTGRITVTGDSTATCTGTVLDDGGEYVFTRGFCWSPYDFPTLSDYYTESGFGMGTFTGTLTGLTPGVKYYVRAYATNATGTIYGEQTFFIMPKCDPITYLPYRENFDKYTPSTIPATGVEPNCWELVQSDVPMTDANRPQLYYKSDYANSGDYSLLLNYRGVYAMPELSEYYPMRQVKLEMYLRQPRAYYALQVGVWEDDGTFVPVATFNNSSTGMEFVECDFSSYRGHGRRIAFRNISGDNTVRNYSYNYIDDIKLTDACKGIMLPYTEDFDSYTTSTTATTGMEPMCWELVWSDVPMTDANSPQIYYKSAYAHSGNYSLLLNYRGIYAMPELSWDMEEITLDRVKLEMYVRQPKAAYQLEVGVWDGQMFVPVQRINNSTTGVEKVTVDFSGFEGWGRQIAFRNVLADGYSYNYSYNYIDDITLTEMVDCSITLPFTESFDGFTESTTTATGVEPDCWELVRTDASSMPDDKRPQLCYNSSFAHSGNYSLKLSYQGVYAMPELSEDVPVSRVKLEMYLRQANTKYRLQVGIWEDNGTFVPVASFDNTTTNVEFVTCDFSNYTGNGRRIAFRNTLDNGSNAYASTNYLDDISLTLLCEKISLPYTEDFESFTASTTAATGIEPTCWELVREDVQTPADKRPQLYYESSFAHSGNYSLKLSYQGVYAMPELSEDVPVSRVKLEMYLRQANTKYRLQVGIWEDNGTFVPVASFDNTTTNVEYVTCDFSNYTGNGRRIAFRNTLDNGSNAYASTNYLDDITLTLGCEAISLPYSENFESYTASTTAATGIEPECWELVQEDVQTPADKRPQLYYESSFAHSGDYSLKLSYQGVYAMPKLSVDVPVNRVKLEMYLRQANTKYRLQVGIWEDNGTFVPVASFDNTTTNVEYVTCDFSNYTGNGRRIAFRNTLDNGSNAYASTNYLDDISLTLLCEKISLPYTEDFESYTTSTTAATGIEPNCWELVKEDAAMPEDRRPQLYYNSGFANSGDYSLKLYNRGVYAMPELSDEVPVNRVRLEMFLRQANAKYQLQVGIWEGNGTFVPVATFDNTTTDVEFVACDFSNYTGNGRRIAFRNTLGSGSTVAYSTNYLDDITLTVMEPCSIYLPYTETFESYTTETTAATGVEPDCWELVRIDAPSMPNDKRPQLCYNSAFAHSGNYSLKMANRCVYAMPELGPNVPVNQISLDMYLRQPNAAYRLEVGVWDDATSTFQRVKVFNNSTTGVEHVTCDFSGYNGNGRRIAFRNTLGSGSYDYSYNYLDDITLTYTESARNAANESNLNSTGIGRLLESVTVYPNPTKDYVNVQCTMNNVHCSGIEVIDMYGKVIYTVVETVHAPSLQTRINVSGLAAGMYFVRVTTEEGTVTKAFVKR